MAREMKPLEGETPVRGAEASPRVTTEREEGGGRGGGEVRGFPLEGNGGDMRPDGAAVTVTSALPAATPGCDPRTLGARW